MRSLMGVLLVVLCTVTQARAEAGSIEDFIASDPRAAKVPGLAYAVVRQGAVQSGAHGHLVKGGAQVMTDQKLFVIGSITKSFTALAVMQLVERGAVDLETPISQYLETFGDSPAAQVTIRQLLSHTSGYSTFQGNDTGKVPRDAPDAMSRQVQRIAKWAPAHNPGTRWDYSNANYYVLGALIEQVSGQDYAAYVETYIFRPLGLRQSFVAQVDDPDRLAVGHTPWFGGARPVARQATDRMSAPVGGIIATASDVARFLDVMMNGTDDILSADGKAEMMRPASALSPHYGLGWFVDARTGTRYHTGLTPGVETLAVMQPADRRAVVVFVNAASGFGLGENGTIFDGIRARALGLDETGGAQGRGGRATMFGLFAAMPLLFVLGLVQAWRGRAALRSKSGVMGAVSLWLPLVAMGALAWVSVWLMPRLFGVSIGTMWVFSPDLALILMLTAGTAVGFAAARLVLARGRGQGTAR